MTALLRPARVGLLLIGAGEFINGRMYLDTRAHLGIHGFQKWEPLFGMHNFSFARNTSYKECELSVAI